MQFNFISNAFAEGESVAARADGGYSLFMIGIIFLLFYFMLIRPQNKRAKEHKDLVSKLTKGDEISTSAGILGRVESLNEQYLKVSVAEDTHIMIQRNAVSAVLPKGTIAAIAERKASDVKEEKGKKNKSKADKKSDG